MTGPRSNVFENASRYVPKGARRRQSSGRGGAATASSGRSQTPSNPFSFSSVQKFARTKTGKAMVLGFASLMCFGATAAALLRTPSQQEREIYIAAFNVVLDGIEAKYAANTKNRPDPTLRFELNGVDYGHPDGSGNSDMREKVTNAIHEMTVMPDAVFTTTSQGGPSFMRSTNCEPLNPLGDMSPLGRHFARAFLRFVGLETPGKR